MDIVLITLLIIICIIQYTKDYFIIDNNQLIETLEYTIKYTEDSEIRKVKSYRYKITYKNKRVKYKTYNIIEE